MRYKMDDGVIVDTSKATERYPEETRWDGRNYISVNTGSQWDHETLYRSRKGRYYLVHDSDWQGSSPRAEWVSKEEACAWLALNEYELPAELQAIENDVSE